MQKYRVPNARPYLSSARALSQGTNAKSSDVVCCLMNQLFIQDFFQITASVVFEDTMWSAEAKATQ